MNSNKNPIGIQKHFVIKCLSYCRGNRKFIEAKKLSDSVVNQNITASSYTSKGQSVTKMNWLDVDKLDNLDSPQTVSKNFLFFCHQFVHSYIFLEYFNDENKLKGVFVSSDRERYQFLYSLEIDEIIKIFEQVGNDYPTNVVFTYNPKKQDYEAQSWVRSVDSAG